MKRLIISAAIATAFAFSAKAVIPLGSEVTWDPVSLTVDGKRVVPVMGEIHYSRVPAAEWRDEVRKMKEGGVTVIATYCFWNHHEDTEGVFDFTGDRDLRRFLEICREENMPVVLRIGPFCHGEARNGGIPDWMFDKGCRLRSEEPAFLEAVHNLYQAIYDQIQGLQWKDGGPLMAVQFDNEYRGRGSYLMALKGIANEIGFDLPFYTRTGWPELATPVPYGELLPLYGDYADGFWDRTLGEGDGNYWQAFGFKPYRKSTAIATEQLGLQTAGSELGEQYPYLTCELGSGMATAYHKRPYVYPRDAYSMTVVKLGSGSNMPGYYMYHGGTNPRGADGKYMNENQRTQGTNYNDLPVLGYDFQAPLDECGRRNPHYYSLRKLHMFLEDMGDLLAPMEAVFPVPAPAARGDDSNLRWSWRGDDRGRAFVFVNNYERFCNLSDKYDVTFNVGGTVFPSQPMTIPSGAMCIFPVNVAGLDYATAQIVAMRNGKLYLERIPGIPVEISIGGTVLRDVRPLGPETPVTDNVYLLEPSQAERLFLDEVIETEPAENLSWRKISEAGTPRTITIGARGVAEAPSDDDYLEAAVYKIELPAEREGRVVEIDYRGDCARIYAGGELVDDNFYYGRTFKYPLWRLPADCNTLELRILPLQPDMPVYFPREADTTPGEVLKSVIAY